MRVLFLLFSEFKRRWRNISAVAIFLSLPVILSLLMLFAFGGNENKKFNPPSVAIINYDDGFLSKILTSVLTNEQMKRGIDFTETTYSKGVDGIKNNDFSAIVIIPKNFTEDFFLEKKPELLLIKNPSQVIYPEIVETALSIMVEGINYLLTFYYPEFEEISNIYVKRGNKENFFDIIFGNSEDLKKLQSDFFSKSKKLFNFFKNLPVNINYVKSGKKRVSISFVAYFFPGFSLFFLMFLASEMALTIVEESKLSITKRLFLTQLSTFEYLLSKFLSGIIFIVSLMVIFFLCGYLFFNLVASNIFLLVEISLISSLFFVSFFMFTTSIGKNERSAKNISMTFLVLMAATGGGMVPAYLLPKFLKSFSSFFPFYRLNNSLTTIFIGGRINQFDMIYSFLFSIICLFFSFVVFKKRLKNKGIF